MKKFLFFIALGCLISTVHGQGLEDIIVETYYISDANDATDTDGGALVQGSVTYRVFVDMAPGYEIQAVYGNGNHPLTIATTTYFFNNIDRGETTGDVINDIRLDENTVALDSWLSLGAASDAHLGVLKSIDPNGSIVGGVNNDGGSAIIPGGLLMNNDPAAGIPLTTSDGLIPGFLPSGVVTVGLDLTVFADANNGPSFTTNSGAWSVLEGVTGPTAENQVLIAQITTDGDLSFEINIQLGAPDGTTEKYVYSNPQPDEIFFAGLTYPVPADIPGCTSDTACNFDPTATVEDGSCLEPVAGCSVCNATNDALVLIDADGDGICDAEEISGCSSDPTACNYNPLATDEEPCIVPVPDCAACNATNDGLVLIDSDGDGICDADEVACIGDFNGDTFRNTADLILLLSQFGCASACGEADLNGTDSVDTGDLIVFLALFGSTCI